jgi:hypothetical protein
VMVGNEGISLEERDDAADGLLSLTLAPSAIYKACSSSPPSAQHTLWSVDETTIGDIEEPPMPLRRWD